MHLVTLACLVCFYVYVLCVCVLYVGGWYGCFFFVFCWCAVSDGLFCVSALVHSCIGMLLLCVFEYNVYEYLFVVKMIFFFGMSVYV